MRRYLIVLGLLIATQCVHAQTGFPMYGSFENGTPDSVNRQNLNTNLQVPIVSQNGRGMDFTFSLAYNSLMWGPSGGKWAPQTAQGTPTWGWNLSYVPGLISDVITTTTCTYYVGTVKIEGVVLTYTEFAYTEPDGTVHGFSATYVTRPSQCGGNSGSPTGYATDASGYYLAGIGKVVSPSGITITNSGVTDTNGNYTTGNTTSNETDWTDTAGHLVLKVITNASTIQYEYQDTTGTYQVITLNLGSYNVKTNFGCSGIVEYTGSSAVTLPSSVVYPNGTEYIFTYEPTPGNSGYVTGRLQKASLPNGGNVTYTFGSTNDGTSCTDGSVVNLSRAIYDGANTATWQFSRSLSGSNWNTTATAPQMPYDSAANQSVYTFNSAAQETQGKLYQGSTSGTLLRTINTTWASNGTPATKITILEDNSTQSEVETTYDSYGNLDLMKEHDFGTGAPGSVLRTTSYTYLSSSAYTALNIMNRVTEKTLADGTGVVQYREDSAYDGSALTSCPTGIAQHNDTTYGCSFATRGNPTSVTHYTSASAPSGAITNSSQFDVFGNRTTATADCCGALSWVFSSASNYASPTAATEGAAGGPQISISYAFNSYTSQLMSVTDPNNQLTSFGYDLMRRMTSVTRPDNKQITTSYNDSSHSITTADPVLGSSLRQETASLDALGRPYLVSTTDASNNLYATTERQFDGLGRLYNTSNPYTSTPQYWTEATFDALGRTVKSILPDGSTTTFAYSAATTTTTDPAGHQRKIVVDGLNRISSVFEPDPTNGNTLTLQTTYGYTVLDKLKTLTQGSQTRSFTFDGNGRMTSQTLPESGVTSFQYTNFNLISQRTDARGVVTSYTYDTMNRPYQISYNVGSSGVAATPTITYSFGTSAAQLNNGRLLSLTDGLGSTTYQYDNLGRATQAQDIISGSTYTLSYQYNLDGSVTSLTYPSGRVVTRTYDAIGRLASISSGGTTYATSFSYDTASQRTGFTMGNGVVAASAFSPSRLQLQSVNYAAGSTIYSATYNYPTSGSNNGQLASITDNVDSGRSLTFGYDALNRLSSALSTGSTTYPQWGLSFTYDRYGNRTAQTVTAGTAVSNSVAVNGATNRITTSGYAYDANGNLTNDGVNTLTYDAENRLLTSAGSGGSGSYSYRASGLRAARTSAGNTTVYLFDGDLDVAEYVNGSLANEYIYVGPTRLASYLSGTLYYHAWDHRTTRVLMNSSGSIVQQQGHYPFGEVWYPSSLSTRRFSSYDRDTESSNDNALQRFYVNRLARFSADDLTSGGGSDPQGFNLYSYVHNDPIEHQAPRSEFVCDPNFDPTCCTNPDIGWCMPIGGPAPGGGGGGGCNPSQAEGDPCPSSPEPPPPPEKPKCFCQLKYRPVDEEHARKVNATHSFWYIQDFTGTQRIISGFPSNLNGGSGYLNDYLNPDLYGGVDNVHATTWYDTGLTNSACLGAELIEFTAIVWPENTITYHFLPGPNSNTFAQYIGALGQEFPASPPGAYGWNYWEFKTLF